MNAKYDWPETEGLVALARKHGLTEAANRLGCPPSSLRARLQKCGIAPEDYRPEGQRLNDAALKEIHDLIS